jgi:hypothetical protein
VLTLSDDRVSRAVTLKLGKPLHAKRLNAMLRHVQRGSTVVDVGWCGARPRGAAAAGRLGSE